MVLLLIVTFTVLGIPSIDDLKSRPTANPNWRSSKTKELSALREGSAVIVIRKHVQQHEKVKQEETWLAINTGWIGKKRRFGVLSKPPPVSRIFAE